MDNYVAPLNSEFGRYVVWYYHPATRKRYDLSPFLQDITISDSFAQAAKEVTMVFSTANAGNALRTWVQMGGIVRVLADTYDGTQSVPLDVNAPGLKNELFRGFVFTRDNTSTSTNDSMSITAYDAMIYLSLNEADLTYKKLRADQIIRRIVADAGMKIGDPFQQTGARIKRMTTRGLTLYDGCLLALEKNQRLTGKRFRLHSKHGRVCLWQRVDPVDTWTFDSRINIESGSHNTSIMDLVTRVTVVYHQNKAIRTKDLIDRSAEKKYGVVHKIVDIGDYSASEVARARQTTLRDHSKPEEVIQLTIPVINSLEPGLGVYVYDDDLKFSQLFWVESVSHHVTPSSGTTDLTLRRREADIKYPDITDPFKANKTKAKYKIDKAHSYPSVLVAVVDFQLDGGGSYNGSESICTIRKGHPLAQSSEIEIYVGKSSTRVSVIGTHAAGNKAIIRLAKVSAQKLRPVVTSGTNVKAVAVKQI